MVQSLGVPDYCNLVLHSKDDDTSQYTCVTAFHVVLYMWLKIRYTKNAVLNKLLESAFEGTYLKVAKLIQKSHLWTLFDKRSLLNDQGGLLLKNI